MPINVIDKKTGKVIAGPGKTRGPKGIGKGQTLRDRLKTIKPRNWSNLHERFGGSEKAKPHSTTEGRVAAGRRKMKRVFQDANKPRPPRPPKRRPWKDWPGKERPERIMTPLRAKKGIGGAIKKVISKVLKPKGVFKPKSVPKSVTDKPTGWSPKGEYTKADDKKITSMLKKLGDEIKAQPLPPKLKETMKKLQKAYPHKKAEGGRIGLKKGSVHKPGSHSWYLQHMNKNKKASGGRIGLKHGGSVGAAVRGHGAEIK